MAEKVAAEASVEAAEGVEASGNPRGNVFHAFKILDCFLDLALEKNMGKRQSANGVEGNRDIKK